MPLDGVVETTRAIWLMVLPAGAPSHRHVAASTPTPCKKDSISTQNPLRPTASPKPKIN